MFQKRCKDTAISDNCKFYAHYFFIYFSIQHLTHWNTEDKLQILSYHSRNKKGKLYLIIYSFPFFLLNLFSLLFHFNYIFELILLYSLISPFVIIFIEALTLCLIVFVFMSCCCLYFRCLLGFLCFILGILGFGSMDDLKSALVSIWGP